MRGLFIFIVGLVLPFAAVAQNFTISGTVKDKTTGKPVEFATVVLENSEQWAVVDAKGYFEIRNVPAGKNLLSVSYLGYVTDTQELDVQKSITGLVIALAEDNLRLESAVVTAKENTNSATTSLLKGDASMMS